MKKMRGTSEVMALGRDKMENNFFLLRDGLNSQFRGGGAEWLFSRISIGPLNLGGVEFVLPRTKHSGQLHTLWYCLVSPSGSFWLSNHLGDPRSLLLLILDCLVWYGQKIIGEPVVSGLVCNDSGLWDPDFITVAKYVMSPPIRESGHDKALQAALSTGVLQILMLIKPSLIVVLWKSGIEGRMHLVWDTMVESGQISVTDYVRITSTECARIFNIYPRKGAIVAGSDADIIIFNPNSSFEISASSHHSRTNTNAYDGSKGKGKVEVTIVGGRVVWQDDELKVVPGSGKYIEMPPFSYLGMLPNDHECLVRGSITRKAVKLKWRDLRERGDD
ncbi:hypothetical protein CRYUN_Cryun25bG0061600 [Craigia yunnanensis]